jgi:hypothetical protein
MELAPTQELMAQQDAGETQQPPTMRYPAQLGLGQSKYCLGVDDE